MTMCCAATLLAAPAGGARQRERRVAPAPIPVRYSEGTVHGFIVQEIGLPAGFTASRIFAIVKVGGHRIFSILVDADLARVAIGQRVRLKPLAVDADPKGQPRWLPAFTPLA